MKYAALAFLLALAACGPVSPERAAQVCEEKARLAQGPTGSITIGSNSRSGSYVSGEVGISLDSFSGKDPMVVYERCVVDMTGQGPIRMPALRS